jgi:hypothetical protein
VIVRRRALVLVAGIGGLFLASLAVVERATRPVASASSEAGAGSAEPVSVPVARAAGGAATVGAARSPAATATAPVPARVVQPGRAAEASSLPVRGAARVDVSFKLDPRLTSGLHMGARWVSPRTYTRTGDLRNVTVEARARVVGGAPGKSRARTAWRVSQPDMVEISPDEGEQVRITVWRPGESRVTVNAGSASETLTVKAAEVHGALRVDIAR